MVIANGVPVPEAFWQRCIETLHISQWRIVAWCFQHNYVGEAAFPRDGLHHLMSDLRVTYPTVRDGIARMVELGVLTQEHRDTGPWYSLRLEAAP